MRSIRRSLSACLLLLAVVSVSAARAAERPIQISLVAPIQIFGEEDSIKGLRLSILYGRNVDVKGVDLGLIAAHATGDVKGVQWSLVSLTGGDFTGWQSGLVNITEGAFTGYQSGWYNRTKGPTEAFQWGLVNVADDMSGFQLGLVNYAKKMDGLQIGLVNVISSKQKLPVLPLVNWQF